MPTFSGEKKVLGKERRGDFICFLHLKNVAAHRLEATAKTPCADDWSLEATRLKSLLTSWFSQIQVLQRGSR